ncbi:efflux RND transporter periplasmic adaptor subunit [Gemmatimonas sp.]
MLPLLAACSTADSPTPELRVPPVPVTVATIGEVGASEQVTVTGTFVSRDEIPLAFKIGGVVARVHVDEGATVQRGQILAALDLREIDAAVAKAQVAVDKAERDQARVQRLAADSVATLAQLQDATSALTAARADLAAARVNRDYAIITAPEAGTVLQRLVTPGANVAPGAPLFTLGGSRRGRVLRAGLPDRDALKVKLNDRATVTFDAVPSRSFEGRVLLVGRSADPRTGTYSVEISLAGADMLPSGLVGNARIVVSGTSAVSTIPVDALLEVNHDSATVFLPQAQTDGTLRAVPQRVRVSQLSGDRATVDGLRPGTRVVAKGASYATAGAALRIITDASLDSLAPTRGDARAVALRGGRAP